MAPCRIVKAPRVAASPCGLECRVTEIFRLKNLEGEAVGNILTLGQVVGVHLDERYVKDGRFDLGRRQNHRALRVRGGLRGGGRDLPDGPAAIGRKRL